MFDLSKQTDLCGRLFCKLCRGFHDGVHEHLAGIIARGGYCGRHGTYHGPDLTSLEKQEEIS
jgi:hypothetical protein